MIKAVLLQRFISLMWC